MALTGILACTPRAPLAPACRPWQTADTSTEPPAHCLYFPRAIAMDPLGDVMYAVNANTDSTFGGSTLVAIDVLRQEHAVRCFRKYGRGTSNDADCGPAVSCDDLGNIDSSSSVEFTEAAEAATGKSSAYYDRCYCQYDIEDEQTPFGLDNQQRVVNCESQRFIMADQTVKVGFFPSSVQILAEDPPDWSKLAEGTELRRGLYIAVRGDPSITFVDVRRPYRPGRLPTQSPGLQMSCGDTASDGIGHEPGQPYSLRLCSDANRVQRTAEEVLVDPTNPDLGWQPRLRVPTEPMEIQIDRGCVEPGASRQRGGSCTKDDGKGGRVPATYYQYLVATHLARGEISAYDLGTSAQLPQPPELRDVTNPPLIAADRSGRAGAVALAPRLPGDLSQPWYVSSRLRGSVATFRLDGPDITRVGTAPLVVPGLSFRVGDSFSPVFDQDVRDLKFQPGGNRAYATIYQPPALVLLDTSTRGARGVPLNQVTSTVNLCLGPERSAFVSVPRRYMGQTVRQNQVYVSCYLSGQLAEVDVDKGELTSITQIGRGPFKVALNFGQDDPSAAIDPCADPYVSDAESATRGVICPRPPGLRPYPMGPTQPGLGPRAYVSMFFDNAIAVVDLDPRSPSYRRLVGRIGLPIPKQVQ